MWGQVRMWQSKFVFVVSTNYEKSYRHKEPLRKAFLAQQQMKSWALHHTEGQ